MDEISIGNSLIPVRKYNGQNVLTFRDIDNVHQRPEGTTSKCFNDSKERFIEGEDYFVRNSYEAAREFDIVAPNGLYLITLTGYIMLAKSFTDDLSWLVYRQLVSVYFNVRFYQTALAYYQEAVKIKYSKMELQNETLRQNNAALKQRLYETQKLLQAANEPEQLEVAPQKVKKHRWLTSDYVLEKCETMAKGRIPNVTF